MAEAPIPLSDALAQLHAEQQSGVYFLWDGLTIVYVGQSRNIRERLCQHIADGRKAFDGVSFLFCSVRSLNSVERHYIEALLPQYNACGIAVRHKRDRSWKPVGATGDKRILPVFMSYAEAREYLGLTDEDIRALRQQGRMPPYRRFRGSRARRFYFADLKILKVALDSGAVPARFTEAA
jgi:excisionase family DNA binding protein